MKKKKKKWRRNTTFTVKLEKNHEHRIVYYVVTSYNGGKAIWSTLAYTKNGLHEKWSSIENNLADRI